MRVLCLELLCGNCMLPLIKQRNIIVNLIITLLVIFTTPKQLMNNERNKIKIIHFIEILIFEYLFINIISLEFQDYSAIFTFVYFIGNSWISKNFFLSLLVMILITKQYISGPQTCVP